MSQQDTSGRKEEERWKRLLTWLQTKGFDPAQLSVEPRTREGAGRGLFTIRTLHPSREPFLSIPAAALLNSRTLKPIYPSIALEGFPDAPSSGLVLNGTQLLSIHLALRRPAGEDSYSRDPYFGPYIDTLPKEFDSHPLKWLVKEKQRKVSTYEEKLLRNLPPSVFKELQGVAKRFWHDWHVASQAKASQVIWHTEKYVDVFKLQDKSLFNLEGFLWGWLVVNTRCLYSDIFGKNLPLSNLTLCPVIDFANHTTSTSLPLAMWKESLPGVRIHRNSGNLLKARDYTLLPPKQTVDEGEELFLRYGAHSNRTLFTEYGFVNESADQEVDVSDLINDLIAQKTAGKLIKKLLPEVAQQFMSDLKMYAVPPPAHPSWSLHCVLRLINLALPMDPDLKPGSAEVEEILKPWSDVTLGEADLVSDANESLVRRDLDSICKILVVRSSEGTHRLQPEDKEMEDSADRCDWYGWERGCVVKLWEEEGHVARTVMEALTSGRAF